MCVLNPHVHMLGDDAAVIAYTTLAQHLDKFVHSRFGAEMRKHLANFVCNSL